VPETLITGRSPRASRMSRSGIVVSMWFFGRRFSGRRNG